jgi:hypothetical protein
VVLATGTVFVSLLTSALFLESQDVKQKVVTIPKANRPFIILFD